MVDDKNKDGADSEEPQPRRASPVERVLKHGDETRFGDSKGQPPREIERKEKPKDE